MLQCGIWKKSNRSGYAPERKVQAAEGRVSWLNPRGSGLPEDSQSNRDEKCETGNPPRCNLRTEALRCLPLSRWSFSESGPLLKIGLRLMITKNRTWLTFTDRNPADSAGFCVTEALSLQKQTH